LLLHTTYRLLHNEFIAAVVDMEKLPAYASGRIPMNECTSVALCIIRVHRCVHMPGIRKPSPLRVQSHATMLFVAASAPHLLVCFCNGLSLKAVIKTGQRLNHPPAATNTSTKSSSSNIGHTETVARSTVPHAQALQSNICLPQDTEYSPRERP
jgi:hypothetical protein